MALARERHDGSWRARTGRERFPARTFQRRDGFLADFNLFFAGKDEGSAPTFATAPTFPLVPYGKPLARPELSKLARRPPRFGCEAGDPSKVFQISSDCREAVLEFL